MPVTTSIIREERGSSTKPRSTEKTKVARQEKVEVSAATSGRLVSRNQSKAATTSGRKSRSQVY